VANKISGMLALNWYKSAHLLRTWEDCHC